MVMVSPAVYFPSGTLPEKLMLSPWSGTSGFWPVTQSVNQSAVPQLLVPSAALAGWASSRPPIPNSKVSVPTTAIRVRRHIPVAI